MPVFTSILIKDAEGHLTVHGALGADQAIPLEARDGIINKVKDILIANLHCCSRSTLHRTRKSCIEAVGAGR
jgi:transposase-like protein